MIIAASIVAYIVAAAVTGALAEHRHDEHGIDCDCYNGCPPWFLLGIVWPAYWAAVVCVEAPIRLTVKAIRAREDRALPEARVIR